MGFLPLSSGFKVTKINIASSFPLSMYEVPIQSFTVRVTFARVWGFFLLFQLTGFAFWRIGLLPIRRVMKLFLCAIFLCAILFQLKHEYCILCYNLSSLLCYFKKWQLSKPHTQCQFFAYGGQGLGGWVGEL